MGVMGCAGHTVMCVARCVVAYCNMCGGNVVVAYCNVCDGMCGGAL